MPTIEFPLSNVSPLGVVVPGSARPPGVDDGKVRVVVVDSRPVVREGLHRVFARSGTIRVVGEAGNVADALPRLRATRPQVVVVEDELAATLCACLRDMLPDVAVLVLTTAEREQEVFAAIEAGATGVVTKASSVETMVDAVETMAAGGSVLDPALASLVMQRLREPSTDEHDPVGLLTDIERTVLAHLAAGRSNRDIATQVCLSESTVKKHVTSVLRALGVQSRTEAAVLGLRAGVEPL